MPHPVDLLMLDLLRREGYEPTPYNLRLVAQAFETGRIWHEVERAVAAESATT